MQKIERAVFDGVEQDDVATFDPRGDGEWTPRRLKAGPSVTIRLPNDGPTVEHRIYSWTSRLTSGRYSGQAANDNVDWPLAKLLRKEKRLHRLDMAERYRALHEAAHAVVELKGSDPSELAVAHRLDVDPSTGALVDRGVRKVRSAANDNDAPFIQGGLRTDHRHPRPLSKPTPKAWQGDAGLLSKLDAQKILVPAQDALGPIVFAFEAAVVGNDTLEKIGHDHGVGNSVGAKGAGRALVMLGFQLLGQHWNVAGR